MRDTNIARRTASYGLRTQQVDGNDVLAVYEAAHAAADQCRAGQGPVFLELLTYRCTGHSRRDPCHYQPKEERDVWRANDPITRWADAIHRRGLATADELAAIKARIVTEFHEAVAQARQEPHPDVRELTTDVYA
jgi:TPP-dependent pyruvate/acetoin dehydrogenase alpha subunit